MRKVVFIISLILCFLISFIVINFDNNEKTILENSINDQIIKTNALTMMYETDVGSGEYQVSTDNIWLGDEYIFNENLSKCENGGILTWDDNSKKVIMKTNTSDRCYIYFDKYNMPEVSSVTAMDTQSDSITISVVANGNDGDILSYHYSSNNGTSYVASENNTYTFIGLTAETTYNISVYVTDINGRKSKVYNIDAATKDVSYTFITSESLGEFAVNSGCRIYLNNEEINIGDTITYKIGDVLRYEQTYVNDHGNGLRIYDANGGIIKEIIGDIFTPSTVEEYILTGLEAEIVAYAAGLPVKT